MAHFLVPEMGIAKGKVGFLESGTLIGIGTVLTQEAVIDNAINTTSSAQAAYTNFWLSSAATLEVASSSANDAAAGTGARTITITGLASDYTDLSETVTMLGNTVAVTTSSFLRINSVEVATAGSGGKNAGVIYVALDDTFSSGVPQTATKILRAIPIGNNVSHNATFTVPYGKELYITSLKVGSSTAQIGTGKLWIKEYGGVMKLVSQGGFKQNQTELVGKNAIKVSAKSDLYVTASAAAASIVVVKMEYILNSR